MVPHETIPSAYHHAISFDGIPSALSN